jgi:MFS family permease
MPRRMNSATLIALMCLCEVLTTLDIFAFASLLPFFGQRWALDSVDMGWISGIFFAGYTLAVPVLVSLTDRIDARPIYIGGAVVIAVSAAGFALFAEGFWTAMVFRFFAGAGFAGAYMPGLRVLLDRYAGAHQGRAVAAYTGFFSFGVAASYLTAGEVEQLFGWRMVFWTTMGAAALAAALIWLLLRPVAPARAKQTRHLLDFRPVLRNREVMGYVLCYGVHAWELLGLRAWIVAFLAFSQTVGGGGGIAPTRAAAIGALFAVFASIGGGELATRFGRRRVIAAIMIVSAAIAAGIGFGATLSYGWVIVFTLIYIVFVQGESAALTTGTVQAAAPGLQGATLAVHSMSGFTGGFLGPLLFGVVLGVNWDGGIVDSWGYAFASLGAVVALGPLFLLFLGRRPNAL